MLARNREIRKKREYYSTSLQKQILYKLNKRIEENSNLILYAVNTNKLEPERRGVRGEREIQLYNFLYVIVYNIIFTIQSLGVFLDDVSLIKENVTKLSNF